MKYVVSRVTLDLGATSSPLTLTAKQGDSVREIIVGFTNNGAVYPLEDSCTVVFTAEKPSGAKIFNECTLDGNNARYKFTAQTVSEIGAMKCEFKIFADMNKPPKLTSPRFMINVEEPVFNDGDVPESSYEFNAISDIVKKVALEYLEEHPAITDKTLTLEDNAADSKAVGDEIKKLLPKSGGTMTGPINMNGRILLGLNEPTADNHAANKGYVDAAKAEAKSYTDESVRKAAPRNLLDNSDFRNPVNHRGFTSTTSTVDDMGIDRWGFSVNSSGSIRLTNDGLVCDKGNLIQKFEPGVLDSAKTYYAVLFLHDGSNFRSTWIEFDYHGDGSGISRVVFYNVSGTVVSAALYEGEYTAETLPEYQPKGYMVEALNCGALHVTTTATLPASGWTDWGYNRYGQSITVSGVLESDFPHITTNDLSGNWVTVKEEYSKIGISWATSNTIHFVCNGEYPTVDIPIQIEVNR